MINTQIRDKVPKNLSEEEIAAHKERSKERIDFELSDFRGVRDGNFRVISYEKKSKKEIAEYEDSRKSILKTVPKEENVNIPEDEQQVVNSSKVENTPSYMNDELDNPQEDTEKEEKPDEKVNNSPNPEPTNETVEQISKPTTLPPGVELVNGKYQKDYQIKRLEMNEEIPNCINFICLSDGGAEFISTLQKEAEKINSIISKKDELVGQTLVVHFEGFQISGLPHCPVAHGIKRAS